jgi:hypothetical protein
MSSGLIYHRLLAKLDSLVNISSSASNCVEGLVRQRAFIPHVKLPRIGLGYATALNESFLPSHQTLTALPAVEHQVWHEGQLTQDAGRHCLPLTEYLRYWNPPAQSLPPGP